MEIQKTNEGFRLTSTICVDRPRSEVFEFFSDAYNLQELTPPLIKFSVLTPPPIEMRVGTLIDYKLKVRGIPMSWQSKITVWEPGVEFVDEMVKGPYKYWRHCHRFEDYEGGTKIIDVVDYDVPFSFIMHPLFVKPDLTKIFNYRFVTILQHFSSDSPANQPESQS